MASVFLQVLEGHCGPYGWDEQIICCGCPFQIVVFGFFLFAKTSRFPVGPTMLGSILNRNAKKNFINKLYPPLMPTPENKIMFSHEENPVVDQEQDVNGQKVSSAASTPKSKNVIEYLQNSEGKAEIGARSRNVSNAASHRATPSSVTESFQTDNEDELKKVVSRSNISELSLKIGNIPMVGGPRPIVPRAAHVPLPAQVAVVVPAAPIVPVEVPKQSPPPSTGKSLFSKLRKVSALSGSKKAAPVVPTICIPVAVIEEPKVEQSVDTPIQFKMPAFNPEDSSRGLKKATPRAHASTVSSTASRDGEPEQGAIPPWKLEMEARRLRQQEEVKSTVDK